jgi:hypothetical protein
MNIGKEKEVMIRLRCGYFSPFAGEIFQVSLADLRMLGLFLAL